MRTNRVSQFDQMMAGYVGRVTLIAHVHWYMMLFGFLLQLAALVEAYCLLGQWALFAWAVVAFVASVWWTFRMRAWVRGARQALAAVRAQRDLNAHLDAEFERIMAGQTRIQKRPNDRRTTA